MDKNITYPKYLFALSDLNACYPEISIVDPKSNASVGFDVVFPTIVTEALKKDPLFNEGKICVLGFPDEEKQKKNK